MDAVERTEYLYGRWVATRTLTWVVALLFTTFASSAWANVGHTYGLREEALKPIASVVEQEIAAGKIPGAVVLIGSHDHIIYRRAFGYRALQPEKQPMTVDTIFDLASLTKVIATTTAVMQLVEDGKFFLEDSVTKYWPEFAAHAKAGITVRDLLTHYSGLRPDLDLGPSWSGYDTALKLIASEKPLFPPRSRYLYSDINFEILGELVQQASGLSLEAYCAQHIFTPLGMRNTSFKPAPAMENRIAPTEPRSGKMQFGIVHDPTAYRMGGVAGHAGLFSTADDLAAFAQMLLNHGRAVRALDEVKILNARTVEQMTTPQSPAHGARLRGLGWDMAAPAAVESETFPARGSYGHTGFTGTSLWIDPPSQTYVVILTNRVHPNGKGDVRALRERVARVVASGLHPQTNAILQAELNRSSEYPVNGGKVQTGIDVLAAEQFAPLAGLRVGLITNHTGLDSAGRRTLDLLYNAPGLKLAAIFSPEHGLDGVADTKVASGKEPTTGLPVYSLYGGVTRPTDTMLNGIDALVFDIQDAGARFYTYITTMAYAMEAAAKKGVDFYVLDRPNPLSSSAVQGPVLDTNLRSFTGYFPLPIRHGMTVGELARMFNTENSIGAKLHVVPMRGYQRTAWYDDTGLRWVAPSPNLHTLTQATLYPGVALIEGANISVGRGVKTPFELLGAPWVNGAQLAAYLNQRQIQGVRFAPADFTPAGDRYAYRVCHGVHLRLMDRTILDAPALGVEIVAALHRLYPKDFRLEDTLGMIGARWVLQAIKSGQDPRNVARQWQQSLDQFRTLRAHYLLY
jgi:uncharacterized protein YbbC (DUF1343 family)/CubicO group peptidase (beta-lactamase class C family)